jgi:hypothetical protein
MKRVEKKLAEWKALYDLANTAQSRLQIAVRMGDAEQIRACSKQAAELKETSERALKAVQEALENVRRPAPPQN